MTKASKIILVVCGVAILGSLWAFRGKITGALGGIFGCCVAQEGVPGRTPTAQEVAASQEETPGQAAAREAKMHYQEGLKYFQSGNYAKAREEWEAGKKLAPTDRDILGGLARLDGASAVSKGAGGK
ncbi:MAG: tetratricopeptide repeat protein [Elusimicrobiales bacterium]